MKKNSGSDNSLIRSKAENLLKNSAPGNNLNSSQPDRQSPNYLSESEALKLIHELEVHQVELEIINVELTLAKEKAAEHATEKYAQLYNFAPSGYLTLSNTGIILEINLSGSQMLGKDPFQLKDSNFSQFVSPDKRPVFNLFLNKILNSKTKSTCELTLSVDGQLPMYVYITGIRTDNGSNCFVNIVDVTDIRKAEINVTQSDERYKSLFEGNHSIMILVDPVTGNIIDANRAACRYYGWSYSEMCSKNISEINQLSKDEIRSEMQMARDEKRNYFIFRHLVANGTIRDVEVYSCPIHFGDSVLLYSLVIDVTDRIRGEEALRESSQKWEAIVAASPDGIGMVSLDGKVELMSDKLLEMYGYAIGERANFLGHSVFDFIDPSNHQKLSDNIVKLFSSEINRTVSEYLAVKKDRSTFYVETSSTVLQDHNGKPSGILYVQRDITERKIAEQELAFAIKKAEESEKKFRSIIQSQVEGIGVVDENEIFEFTNLAAAKIFETGPEELMGTSLYDYLTFDEIAKIEQQTFERKNGVTNSYELQIVTKKGNERYLHISSSPKFSDNGKYLGAFGVFSDITDRKMAELLRDQQLSYTKALNEIAEVIISNDKAGEILAIANRIVGETLKLDRSLIYEVSFARNCIIGLCEWLREDHPDIVHTKNVYPLSLFVSPLTEIKNTQKYLESRFDAINPFFIVDGSSEILHQQMHIKNLLWYPFDFDENGYHLFTLNQIHELRKWTNEEIGFLESVARQVNLALIKIRLLEDKEKVATELRENEEKYRFMFANNPQPMWIVESKTLNFLEVNQSAINHYGYSKEEFLSMSIMDIRPVEEIDKLQKFLELSFLEGLNIQENTEWQHIKKNGEIIFVETVAHSMNFNGRKAHHVLITDITERKKGEIEVQDKKNLLTNLIINLEEGILLEDADRKIVLTNQLFCDMFAIPAPPEAMVGADCHDSAEQSKHFFRSPEKFIADLKTILANRKTILNDELELNDGRYLERDYIPTYLNNEYSGHLWKYRDITSRKQAELKIIDLNTNLDRKIEQRTDQLSEANYLLELEIEERVKATVAMEGALNRLQKIASRLPGVVYEFRLRPDGSSCFPYASDGVKTIYRVTSEEILDDASVVFTRIYPDDFDGVVASIAASARDLTIWRHQYRVKYPDGTICWLSSNAMPQREADGSTLWYGFISDITERRQREDELNQVSTRLALATSTSGVGVWDYDLVNDILVWDDQMFALYGIKKEDFSGAYEAWQSGLHSADKERGDREIKMAITGEKDFDTEFRVVWPNDTVRHLRAMAIVQRDDSGKPLNLVGTNWDITEQKQAEQALRLSETRHSSMIANISDVIAIMGMDGTIKYKSPNIEKYFGWQPNDLIGTNGWATVHPDDLDRLQKEFYDLVKNPNSAKTVEYRYKCKDGSYRPIELTATNLLNDNVISGLLFNYHDITDRMKAEEFEDELFHLSLQLTGIPVSEIDGALELALNKIGGFLGADRAYIFELDANLKTMNNTFEWCREGIQPEIENLQNVPCDLLPMWMEKLKRNENIIIPSVPDLPNTWIAEREILEPQGIQSLVVIPMFLDQQPIGFVGLDSVFNKKQYSIAEINILKVWGNLLTSLINHKKKEEIIEQTRINYETFFNTIDDFLFVLDTQGNIIHTNTTVTNRLQYSSEELLSKSVLQVHPPERREEAGRIVGEMLAGSADFCPVPLVTKSGDYIPVETRVKAGFWDGKPVMFGVTKDVSKIKLSEEKFSKAFQSNSALMAITGFNDGVFLDVNESFTRTLGYSHNELIGKNLSYIKIFDNPDLRKSISDSLKQQMPVRDVEMVANTKSGAPIIGLFSADVIYIGKDMCVLTMIVDITERKKAEEELKKARKEADLANVAKSEFLSRMSHELRTPMNSILGFAQLLQMGTLTPRQKTGVGHILNSGKHLLNLINEVLDISRIEAGKISLSMEPIQLLGVIREMMDIVKPNVLEKQQTLEFSDSPANDMFVIADSKRLKQVLLNLINNAIKYNCAKGKVTIKTELLKSEISGSPKVRISVTDTGWGISAEDLPKLFKPFERIGAEKTETEGTGLGLAVVKKLMDAMAGIIGVESTVGVGSTFWIELLHSESPLEIVEKSGSLLEIPLELDVKSGTILYIEDNVSNIELIDQILSVERPQIQLISNKNGRLAVPLAIENKPNLILLDLDLPDIHGTEVLMLLHDEELTRKIPVVILSADAMPKQIEKLMDSGAKNYLTKPIDIVLFLKTVDEWVGK